MHLLLTFCHLFTGSQMNSHLFVWLRLLSMEISPMNIHLWTSREPQANQMSNLLCISSHHVGHFMLKRGKPFHTYHTQEDGGD